jgi:hypothetical protein
MTLTLGTPTTATGLDANSSPYLPNYNMLIPCGTDRAVYVYYNTGSNIWEVRAVTTSGMSISTIGSPATLLDSTEASNLGNGLIFPFELSATHFGICWLESTGFPNCRIRVRISSVSGTTITPGTAGTIVTFGAFVALNSLNASRITDTRACCVWRDPGGTNNGHAAAFNITGTTVGTPGSTIIWSSGTAPQYIYADSLRDDQHVIISSRHSGAWAVVLDNTGGTTLVSGTEVQVSTATNAVFTMVLGMSATRAQYAYAHNTSSPDWRGRARQLDISGTTITPAGSATFWGGTAGQSDLVGWANMRDGMHGIMNIHNNSLTQFEEAIESSNNGTMGVGGSLSLVSPSVRENMGVAFVGGDRAIIIYDTNQIAVISTDLISLATHLWKSTDGAATFANIGDSSWGSDVVTAIVAKPNDSYQTIWISLSDGDIYKTSDGGTSWASLATLGYSASELFLLDGDILLASNRATGGNRVSTITQAGSVSHIDTSHSTTGEGSSVQGIA